MKPIRSIEEFEEILKRAEKEHKKRNLQKVSLEVLKEVAEKER